MSASRSTSAPQNALSVLLAALPSDIASSIEAGFNVATQELFATGQTSLSSSIATRPTPSSPTRPAIISTSRSEPSVPNTRQSERPTSGQTARPTSDLPSSQPILPATLQRTSEHSSRPTPPPETLRPTTLSTVPSVTPTTSSSIVSSSTSSIPVSTSTSETTQPTITPARQQANGTIAGIATGAAAGVVLLTLAIFFFLRRRQRQRTLKANDEKATQSYPEVAWLYDPVQSPPTSRSPAPQLSGVAGDLGMTQAQAKRSSLLAPEVVMPEGEPLLAPGRAVTRDNSPAGDGRVRSASPGAAVR